MDEFPIQILLFPLLGVIAVIYMVVMRKRRITGYDQQYANYRASELAKRLGLTLVSGDPNFNFFIIHADRQIMNGPTDKKAVDVDVKMVGAPEGVNLELIYIYHVTQKTGMTEVRRDSYFDCRMIAHTKQPFPPFEVVSRSSAMGPIPQTMAHAPIATGNPLVDQSYIVVTGEPGMAQVLGNLLPSFAQFTQNGVHLLGDGNTISFVMKQNSAPLVANALYYAETMASNLTQMARTIGG